MVPSEQLTLKLAEIAEVHAGALKSLHAELGCQETALEALKSDHEQQIDDKVRARTEALGAMRAELNACEETKPPFF